MIDGDALLSRLGDLSSIRGRLTPNAPMETITWFRVGGPAELLFQPADEDDLGAFLKLLPPDVPVLVVGICSNLLVRDGGIPGVVLRLSAKGFGQVEIVDGEQRRHRCHRQRHRSFQVEPSRCLAAERPGMVAVLGRAYDEKFGFLFEQLGYRLRQELWQTVAGEVAGRELQHDASPGGSAQHRLQDETSRAGIEIGEDHQVVSLLMHDGT